MPLRTRSKVSKGSTASSPNPKGQSLGNSSLALGVLQDQIKTLAQRVEFVGKRIKTSKTKVTWSFNIKQVCFTVELFDSKSSGKRRVHVNGHLAKEVSAKGATTLQFRNTGLSFEVAIGDKSPAKKSSKGNKAGEPDCVAASVYDLRVDGHSFAEIHTAMLTASRAEHALAQPPSAEEMLAPTVDNQHVAAAAALTADAADAADPAGGCERRESKSDTGARAASGKDEEAGTGGSVRVSNSSVRVPTGHCPGDDTVPDCLNVKMSEGLEENRMHADRYSRGVSSEDLDLGGHDHDHTAQKLSAFLGETETEAETTASSTPSRRSSRRAPPSSSSLSSSSSSGRKRAAAVSNKPSIAGLETLGHHDDFYRQDEPAGPDLLTSPFTPGHARASVASSFLSSTSTQFDSALSHFDSTVASPTTTTAAAAAATPTTTTTAASFASPPPRSITSTGAGGTIPLAECVISPQAHNTAVVAAAAAAAVLPIVNPFDTDAGVVDAETKKRTAAAAAGGGGGRGHGGHGGHGGRAGEAVELEKLRAENAVLKLRAENAALKAQVQAAPAVPVAGAYHAPAQQQYVMQHHHQLQQYMMHHHQQQQHFMYMQQQRQSAPTLVSRAGPTAVSPNTRKSMDCAMLLKLNGMLALNRPSAATAQPVVSRP